MAVQWGNNSALAGFQNALAMGADIGGAIRQNRVDSALSGYLGTAGGTGPEAKAASDAAFQTLNKVDPRLAFQVQGQMAQRDAARAKAMQEQNAAALRQRAAQGDAAALQQLVGIDFDSWKALDANKRDMVKGQTAYTGQAALRISQLPAAEQPAAWDQAIEQGVQAGYSGLGEYRGKFSPEALRGAIDNAGLVEKFIGLAEPKYMVRPEKAELINVRDPAELARLQSGQGAQPAEPTVTRGGKTYRKVNGQWVEGDAASNGGGGFR